MCEKYKVVDAGDAVRAELREHEQALLEEEEAEMEAADQAKLHVRLLASLLLSLALACTQQSNEEGRVALYNRHSFSSQRHSSGNTVNPPPPKNKTLCTKHKKTKRLVPNVYDVLPCETHVNGEPRIRRREENITPPFCSISIACTTRSW